MSGLGGLSDVELEAGLSQNIDPLTASLSSLLQAHLYVTIILNFPS